jgi:hypothetical protein
MRPDIDEDDNTTDPSTILSHSFPGAGVVLRNIRGVRPRKPSDPSIGYNRSPSGLRRAGQRWWPRTIFQRVRLGDHLSRSRHSLMRV